MFCKNCGSNISDDAVFCPNCGTQVGEGQSQPQAAPVAENKPNNNTAKPQTSNAVGLVGFILSMVSVLFWIIGLIASSGLLFIVSLMLGIGAIVCSAIGMNTASKQNAPFRGLSISGLVVGIVVVAISIILFIIGLAALSVMF
ncbi:MAG: zinc-ribbon domain-containing protein [Clostridiales bacterium]|nr:zinc-ribbon domain-containing protein [Clostridiales bacterium]